jgi:hypothetical protein
MLQKMASPFNQFHNGIKKKSLKMNCSKQNKNAGRTLTYNSNILIPSLPPFCHQNTTVVKGEMELL